MDLANSLVVGTPGDTDVVVTRQFNTSVALVWRACSEPDPVRRRMVGYPGWTMPVCEVDFRVGGGYH